MTSPLFFYVCEYTGNLILKQLAKPLICHMMLKKRIEVFYVLINAYENKLFFTYYIIKWRELIKSALLYTDLHKHSAT